MINPIYLFSPSILRRFKNVSGSIAPLWKTNVHLEIPKHLKISLDDLFDQQPRPRVDQGAFGIIDQIKIKEGHVENYGPDQVNPTYSYPCQLLNRHVVIRKESHQSSKRYRAQRGRRSSPTKAHAHRTSGRDVY